MCITSAPAGHNARDVVEMAFWVGNFIKTFEKEMAHSEQRIKGIKNNHTTISLDQT